MWHCSKAIRFRKKARVSSCIRIFEISNIPFLNFMSNKFLGDPTLNLTPAWCSCAALGALGVISFPLGGGSCGMCQIRTKWRKCSILEEHNFVQSCSISPKNATFFKTLWVSVIRESLSSYSGGTVILSFDKKIPQNEERKLIFKQQYVIPYITYQPWFTKYTVRVIY